MMKTAVITGGSCGLGAAIAREFAKNGYNIILTYCKNKRKAEVTKEKLKNAFGVDVRIVQVDLEEERQIEGFIKDVKELDVLINCAAYNDDDDVFRKNSLDFVKAYKINAVAPFLLSKGFYERLKERRGVILNVASTNGIDTFQPFSIDYDASKAALLNLTKNLSLAFAPLIRVNAIAPGWLNTDSTRDMEPKYRKSEEKKILLGRFADVEEVAKVAYFLCSNEASYINGEIIRVDGGIKNGN